MQQLYLSKGKELLKLIINNGFEGFFVGEAIRNTIMNMDYSRVDIITNATIDDLNRIYQDHNKEMIDDETLMVNYFDYNFYFQTFSNKKDKFKIDNRSTLQNHYAKNLLDDLSTKNFTINAIAMSYSGKVTDAYGGIDDIKYKRIRTIANPKQRFTTYPVDILEALVLRSKLKFKISKNTYKQMRKRSKLLTGVSSELVIEKLDEVLNSKYAKKAIIDLAKLKMYRYIPSLNKGLVRLANRYKTINIEELLLMSFVLNGQFDNRYTSAISNHEVFMKTYNLALANKKGIYDSFSLFSNGLDVCLEANRINYLLGKSTLKTNKIKKQYELLPIKKACDLAFKGEEILRITGINDTVMISDIIDEVIASILMGELENDYKEIQEVVLEKLNERGIYYNLSRKQDESIITGENKLSDTEILNKTLQTDYTKSNKFNFENEDVSNDTSIEEASNQTDVNEDTLTNHRLRILEERLDEQDKLLQEKSEKLEELEREHLVDTANKIVSKTINQICADETILASIKDLDDFENEYRKFLTEYLKKDKGDN